ncbi:MAG TPA: hypothetical protein PKC73_00350 [Dermatophilaceae bacterium]|jgi:hypothetical protein|nr:hypothetical protein [Dermatophilaceae bacterium]
MKFLRDAKATMALAVSKSFIKKAVTFLGIVLGVAILLSLLPRDVVNAINTFAWVLGNVMLAYVAFAQIAFIIAYYTIFDPSATTGGRLIFRFMLSFTGVIVLVPIGIFIDPAVSRVWLQFPVDTVEWWHPLLRLAIYGFVAYSISSLAWLLAVRKWFPHKVKKASDINLIKVRHTAEIPVIKAVLPELIHDGDAEKSDSQTK